MAPFTGGFLVNFHVLPPSCEVAVSAWLESFVAKSPPPTMPFMGSRKATLNPPAVGELIRGVSYAFHESPPSVVARILAIFEPPVAIQALFSPSVVTQVPLEENDASPFSAGGLFLAMLFQF